MPDREPMTALESRPTVPAVRFCGEPTETGEPCRQVVGIHSGTGRCIWHDPKRMQEALQARQNGAATSNSRPRAAVEVPPPGEPRTLGDVIGWHSWIAVTLASGQIDKATATGLAYNLQQLRCALVSRDLALEVEQLRAMVAALKQRRAG